MFKGKKLVIGYVNKDDFRDLGVFNEYAIDKYEVDLFTTIMYHDYNNRRSEDSDANDPLMMLNADDIVKYIDIMRKDVDIMKNDININRQLATIKFANELGENIVPLVRSINENGYYLLCSIFEKSKFMGV